MLLKEVMTRDVGTIGVDATLQNAAKQMRNLRVGILPVLDSGRLVGVVTDRDLVVRAMAEGWEPTARAVRETMTTDVIALDEDEDLTKAIETMEAQQIGRIIVTDRQGALVGILTASDAALLLHGDARASHLAESLAHRNMDSVLFASVPKQ